MLHQRKLCPKCGEATGVDAAECLQCGHLFRTSFANPDQTVMASPVETGRPSPAPTQIVQPYQPPAASHQQVVIYQQAPPVYYAPEAPRDDVCAILSLVLGIAAGLLLCFFGWIPGVGAVLLGAVSLARQHRDPWLSGQGMAIAGIVFGIVAVAWSGWVGYHLMMPDQPGLPIQR